MKLIHFEQNFRSAEQIAKIISAVFHPLILPAIAFILLIIADPNDDIGYKVMVGAIAIAFSVVIVLVYIFYLKHKGIVDSTDITVREQRINPLVVGVASYFIGFLLLKATHASHLLQGLMFCYATNTLLVVLITNWWKVSIHTTAVSGPLVALTYQFGKIIFPFYVFILLVGASRLILKRHTLPQVIVGAAIGLLLTALQLKVFL